ncbi:hypothetical protein Dsin_024472 [Dipteronia sinensis]|uniref:Uncharacterized protein n=1 Tax=Dipteronia sinensis TaxID=43782 RepID=A0AAD9ZU22_9ROSI|nr:hypothetical protein Dsin_024472 [Dipteronia sinensis]
MQVYVVSKLLKEKDTEAWGVEPYDLDDADDNCNSLVRSIGWVVDIKFPMPYRPKLFSLVTVSDAVMDYLAPKYLNKTLTGLARLSADGVVIIAGYLGQHRAKVAELSKFSRPSQVMIKGCDEIMFLDPEDCQVITRFMLYNSRRLGPYPSLL